MTLLLDSHVLLWWLITPDRLGPRTCEIVSDGANQVFVSAASVWELSIKQSVGKLELPGDLNDQAAAEGFTPLPVDGRHAALVRTLPLHHRDPFDRLLVAQALREGLTLVTADPALQDYDVPILPAGL